MFKKYFDTKFLWKCFKNVLEILLPNVMDKHFKNIMGIFLMVPWYYNIYQYKSVESADFVYISESFITNYLNKMLRIKLFVDMHVIVCEKLTNL